MSTHVAICSDQRLPDRGRNEREDKQLRQERERAQKWVDMFREERKYFGARAKYRDRMINRVYKGVPDSVRGAAWYILLDIGRIKKEQKGTYQARCISTAKAPFYPPLSPLSPSGWCLFMCT